MSTEIVFDPTAVSKTSTISESDISTTLPRGWWERCQKQGYNGVNQHVVGDLVVLRPAVVDVGQKRRRGRKPE